MADKLKKVTINLDVEACGCMDHEIQKCSMCIDILQAKKKAFCEVDETLQAERLAELTARTIAVEEALSDLLTKEAEREE